GHATPEPGGEARRTSVSGSPSGARRPARDGNRHEPGHALSARLPGRLAGERVERQSVEGDLGAPVRTNHGPQLRCDRTWRARRLPADRQQRRSEEHTSELQSRENLVCRLLLEKKKEEYSCSVTSNR